MLVGTHNLLCLAILVYTTCRQVDTSESSMAENILNLHVLIPTPLIYLGSCYDSSNCQPRQSSCVHVRLLEMHEVPESILGIDADPFTPSDLSCTKRQVYCLE